MEVYKNGKVMLQRISCVMDRVLAGETETTACLKENVDKSWLRRFLRSDISIKQEDGKGSGSVEIDCDDWMCWQDQFLTDLTGQEYYVPDGFDQIYKECTEEACSEQQREVLRLRYQEGLTLRATGERIGKTQERVRQAESKALRVLRHPKYRYKLIYGREYMEALDKARGAQAEYDKARLSRMEKIVEERKAAVQKCRAELAETVKQLEYVAAEPDRQAGGMSLEEAMDAIPLSALGLSVRVYNALTKHLVYGQRTKPIETAGQLAKLSREELYSIRNLGKRCGEEVEAALFEQFGIRLSDNGKKQKSTKNKKEKKDEQYDPDRILSGQHSHPDGECR